MRLAIINTNVIAGDGHTLIEDCSVIVEKGIIIDIIGEQYPYYEPADEIIDARSNLTIPGLINHHVHGLSIGPIQAIAQPPLSEKRARHNLNTLLSQGVTTALNVDGFPTVEEVDAVGRQHPINLKTTTLHSPKYLKWANSEQFGYGTIADRQSLTCQEMLARGAVALGEAGPGSDKVWPDYVLIPRAIEKKTGQRIYEHQAAQLREAVQSGADKSELAQLLDKFGLSQRVTPQELIDLVMATQEMCQLAQEAGLENAALAKQLDVSVIVHNTPTVAPLVKEIARENGSGMIAGHSNLFFEADEAIKQARYIKAHGGWVDIMGGDFHRGARFFKSLNVHFAMLQAGVVDLLSTDYCGGFWDPMLLVLEKCVGAGVITLPQAIALVTGNVHQALPELSPNRGFVRVGKTADLAIVDRNHISTVHNVIVQGQIVFSRDVLL